MRKSKFFTTVSESDERSESDAASRRSSGSELEEEELVGNSGRDSRSFRKRTKSEDGQSSSDNEKGSAPKIPTGSRGGVQRGRGRGLTAQESAQRAEKLAAEGRHPGAVSAGERPPRQAGGAPDAGADSAEEARRSFGELMVAALRDMGRKRLAKPSSKEKTVLKHATSLSEAFDKALDKSVAKLRAELRAELRAGPAGPGAVRREAVGGGPGQGQGQSQPQPQPEAGNQLLTLVQSELAAFRQQLQQQQQQFQLQIQRQLSLLEGIFYLVMNLAVGGTGYFPDGVRNPSPKPWWNGSPTAARDFWNARGHWLPTWNLNVNDGRDASLQVDYVRIWAL
ncbi:hypothetical protein PYW08_014838 [Mythimna loreyi]|uniref:Uncharacterized protein n=1 Tax=Mythimna loreyi TaxID=667449 RepID=A0ACC2R404_9NEOP|nr:hypothetical protein PYW08_014838 [Mythimna loreyi]